MTTAIHRLWQRFKQAVSAEAPPELDSPATIEALQDLVKGLRKVYGADMVMVHVVRGDASACMDSSGLRRDKVVAAMEENLNAMKTAHHAPQVPGFSPN